MDALKETIKTFDKYADQYAGKYMNYEPYVQTYLYLSSLLPADAKVLDVACGPGNIAKCLLDENTERKILGVDLSKNMVILARGNNPSANFEVMDSRSIACLGSDYDAIVAGFLLPYLSQEEVSQFIRDARAMMKAGAILYISFMEGDYETSGLQTRNNIDWVYIYYYPSDYIIEQLKTAGFEIIGAEQKSFSRDGEPEAVDVFIYARAS